MALKNVFTKDRITAISVFLACFVLFSVVYFILPMNMYNGEFISDYSFVELVKNGNVTVANLFHTNVFYGKFLHNIIVYLNIKTFSYSFTFIKIANYIVTLLLFVVCCLLFWDRKISGKTGIFSLVLLVLLSTNFVNIYDACSLIDAKILVLVVLVSLLLVKLIKKSKNEIVKFVLLSCLSVVQLLAFFFPLSFVVAYYIIRNDISDKKVRNATYILASTILLAAFILNYNVFTSLGFKEGFDFDLFFSSSVMPINRIIPTEHAATFVSAVAIFGVVVISIVLLNELVHKRFIRAGFFAVLIVLEALSYKRHEYYLSKLYQINIAVMAYFIYSLINDEKPQFAFFKFFKGKIGNAIKPEMESIGTRLKKGLPYFVGTVYLVTSGVSVAFLVENKEIRDEFESTLGYIKNYDDGYLDDKASYFYDIDKKDFNDALNPYLDNGYISVNENPLPDNEGSDTLENATLLRGIQKDEFNICWLTNNFAFESYCTDRYMKMTLFSIVDKNKLSIYCNNKFMGTYDVMKESNCIDVDLKEFMNSKVVIRGEFEKVVVGPFQKDVKYASEFLNLSFSNCYGMYGRRGLDGDLWCNKDVGFYYKTINTNKMFAFFNPENVNNECSVSINGSLVKNYTMRPGVNEIMLNMVPYYGQETLINFSFQRKLPFVIDNKPIYCKFDGEISSKNDGIYPTGDDGLVWCNNDFTFYYDDKYTGDTRYRTYKFYVPGGVADNPTHIYVNDTLVKDTVLVEGTNEVFIDLLPFKGQILNVRFKMDNYIHSQYDNREKTCVFQGVVDSDSYGITSEKWCSKEFGFYYREFHSEHRYRKYALYSPLSHDNHIKVFVNGELFKEKDIHPGNNELALDLHSFEGMNIDVSFEFDESTNSGGRNACIYHEYSDSNFYGLRSDSFSFSNNWCEKEFAFYIENLSTSGKYRIFNFYVPDGVENNPLDVIVNDEVTRSSFLVGGQNQLVVDLSSYVGMDIELKFVLANALPVSGNDKEEKTCMYHGYSDANVYGLHSAPAGEDPWCKKEFAFFYENLEIDSRFRCYSFYMPDSANENPYKVYVNGVLAQEGVARGGMTEIAVDLYSFLGGNVEVKFIFENQLTSGTDKRELVCLYKGYVDKNTYGIYDAEPSGNIFTKKNFGFVFNNIQSNKKFRFYIPDALIENPMKVYINGVLFLEGSLAGGVSEVELDLTSYIGTDISVAFSLEKTINGTGDSRELGSLYLGVEDVPFPVIENN